MFRRRLILSAFTCAVCLTIVAGWQLMIYLNPPAWRIALWSPFAGLLHARELGYIFIWLVQYPLLAGVFAVASCRWSPVRVLLLIVTFYALCALGAFFMVKAYPYGPA